MATTLTGYRITRYHLPLSRVIGDSQVRFTTYYMGTVELYTNSDLSGLGFVGALLFPLAPQDELERLFATEVWPGLVGQHPISLLHRQSRPRGGNIHGSLFGEAVNQALWDLYGKEVGLPLYRLLGGTNQRVRAYASGLDFHLTLDESCAFFGRAAERGFDAFKVKVGHPDLAWDLERLRAIVGTVGRQAILMVDANEAWSPKEAIRRAHAYHAAGFNVLWIEDPCLRDDFVGLATVAQNVPFAYVNSGEYLDLHGKRLLLEHRGTDMLNVHSTISDGLRAGWLAAEYGIPISVGNTPLEVGVHLAAALPEAHWIEYSFLDYNHVVEQPVEFVDGYAVAPERPGHGLVLSESARQEFGRPEVEM